MYVFIILTHEETIFHVHFCHTVLFKKSAVSVGIRLYNKVPVHLKRLDKFESFKKELKPVLLYLAFIQWMNLCHSFLRWIVKV